MNGVWTKSECYPCCLNGVVNGEENMGSVPNVNRFSAGLRYAQEQTSVFMFSPGAKGQMTVQKIE